MFEKGDSSNRQKIKSCSFKQLLHRKIICLLSFVIKPTKGALVLLKNGTKDFQNSLWFERSACFYMTITGNSEHFQYLNFEKIF